MVTNDQRTSFGGNEALHSAFPNSFVRRDFVTASDVTAYEDALSAAMDEHAMQRFLEANPCFLVQSLAEEAGAWVIPQARLGAEFVTDFLIAEIDYGQPVWRAVELERPQVRIFTKKGDPSSVLMHAVRQIEDWRNWLSRNLDYASRSRHQSGLNLTGIEPSVEGLIVIGREHDVDSSVNDSLRSSFERSHNLKIRTYDWLADLAKKHLTGLRGTPEITISSQKNSFENTMRTVGTTRRQLDLTTMAINNTFGGVFSTSANPSAAREINYEGITFSFGGNPDRDVDVPLCIVKAHPAGRVLELSDWTDWIDYVARDIGADFSLLVSERLPSEILQNALSQKHDGVWHEVDRLEANAFGHAQPRLGRFDVLVHVSPKGTYIDRTNRLRAARGIFHQQIMLRCDEELDREAEIEIRVASLSLAQGDIVSHERFGTGIILSISGFGSNASATINFGTGFGTKNIALGYVNIKKKI